MKKNLLSFCAVLIATAGFSQTFNSQRLDSLFQNLDAKNKFMGSIAVSIDGKPLYSKTIGFADLQSGKKADEHTKYRIGSISKMFTAALILKAAEDKKLDLKQTIESYFPEIANSNKITINNLLNHRSGIHNFTSDSDYLKYNTTFKSQKEMIRIISDGGSDFEPGSKAAYSNSNYILLSYILENFYQKKYNDILSKQIIKPLKLTDTYLGSKIDLLKNESNSYEFKNEWVKDAETDLSIPIGAGGIVSNPTDLNLFIDRLFAGKVISEKSLEQMKTMTDKFGLGLFEFPYFEIKNYGHDGSIDAFQSVVVYNDADKLAIAITSNGTQYPINNILLCALSSYYGKPFKIPTFQDIKVSLDLLNQYEGEYSSAQIPPKISITNRGQKLFAQATGQSEFPLEATSQTSFKFEQAGIVLEFDANKKTMTLKQGGKEFLFTKE